jgi:hypothetical protein
MGNDTKMLWDSVVVGLQNGLSLATLIQDMLREKSMRNSSGAFPTVLCLGFEK